jgi:hypothetical protein
MVSNVPIKKKLNRFSKKTFDLIAISQKKV